MMGRLAGSLAELFLENRTLNMLMRLTSVFVFITWLCGSVSVSLAELRPDQSAILVPANSDSPSRLRNTTPKCEVFCWRTSAPWRCRWARSYCERSGRQRFDRPSELGCRRTAAKPKSAASPPFGLCRCGLVRRLIPLPSCDRSFSSWSGSADGAFRLADCRAGEIGTGCPVAQ